VARVLVVDDDPDILNLVQLRLRKQNHQVATARGPGEAVGVVRDKGRPDLCVLDVSMPGMTGLELLEALRDDHDLEDTPVIFLSARVQPEDVQAGNDMGAIYLTKPFVASALLAAVDRALMSDDDGGTW
jgi:DNA-binding response OmpR family regulator